MDFDNTQNYMGPLTQMLSGGTTGASLAGPWGAAAGALYGLGSGVLQNQQTQSQQKQMQDMINSHYSDIVNTINKEYAQNAGAVGQAYNAGTKATEARQNQMLGAQGLAGSPTQAAMAREDNNQASNQAGNAIVALGEQKSAQMLAAQNAQQQQQQALQLGGMQGQQTNFNTSLSDLGKAGTSLATLLTPQAGLDTSIFKNDVDKVSLPANTNGMYNYGMTGVPNLIPNQQIIDEMSGVNSAGAVK